MECGMEYGMEYGTHIVYSSKDFTCLKGNWKMEKKMEMEMGRGKWKGSSVVLASYIYPSLWLSVLL